MPASSDDEYYHTDLVGSAVLDLEQKLMGKIIEIHNFGAGDIIEMELLDSKKTIFLPFEQEFVTEVDLEKKILVFDFIKAGI